MVKKKPAVRVTVQKASCELFASSSMACPLCQVTISANTYHKCERNQ